MLSVDEKRILKALRPGEALRVFGGPFYHLPLTRRIQLAQALFSLFEKELIDGPNIWPGKWNYSISLTLKGTRVKKSLEENKNASQEQPEARRNPLSIG
jgi:hypothetical protein